MGHQLPIRLIFSFCLRQRIWRFLFIICITGLSFMVIGKYVERVFLLNKSESEINLSYLKGNSKYERPSSGNLEVYNLSTKVAEDIECKEMRTNPPTSLCYRNSSVDNSSISAHIRKGIVFEPGHIHIFQGMLREDEALGLLDLGANVGVYSMVAAAMNRPVLSVEPVEGNLKILAKAVQVNGYQGLITVLPYAITDIHTKLHMSLHPSKQGQHRLVVDKEHDIHPEQKKVDVETIVMDDLEPYVPFKKAIMKIDIEGQEHRAFVHSKALMDKVEFPYIFMEWAKVRQYNKTDGTEDNAFTVQLIDLLSSYGYTPFNTYIYEKEKLKLKTADWGQWPTDIIWSKRDK